MNITDQNFDSEIKNFQKPVLVDFYAEWCAPCGHLGPILEKVAERLKDKMDFVKVNLDGIPNTAQKLGIDRIPTVVLFKEGQAISGFIGVQPEEVIMDWLNKVLETGNDSMLDKMIAEYESYAAENGFKLNPDKETVKKILTGILENEKKHGKKYCPCRRVVGDQTEDDKKVCPCQWHKDEIEKEGHCLCMLFVK